MSEEALVKLAVAAVFLLAGVIGFAIIYVCRAYLRRTRDPDVGFSEATTAVLSTCTLAGCVFFSAWSIFDTVSFIFGPRILAFFRSFL